jgi:glucokinase
MMTIGTGIGTSTIINGQLLRGKHFQAGCLGGHFTVNYEGATCTCGNIGCVEAQASTWNIEEKIKSSKDFYQSLLSAHNTHDFSILFQAAKQKDPLAKRIVDECLNIWSAGVINLIHAYDPEIIVLGGGILNSKEEILPRIQQRVDQYAWTPWGRVEIRPSQLMDRAGIMGVVYCLTHQI